MSEPLGHEFVFRAAERAAVERLDECADEIDAAWPERDEDILLFESAFRRALGETLARLRRHSVDVVERELLQYEDAERLRDLRETLGRWSDDSDARPRDWGKHPVLAWPSAFSILAPAATKRLWFGLVSDPLGPALVHVGEETLRALRSASDDAPTTAPTELVEAACRWLNLQDGTLLAKVAEGTVRPSGEAIGSSEIFVSRLLRAIDFFPTHRSQWSPSDAAGTWTCDSLKVLRLRNVPFDDYVASFSVLEVRAGVEVKSLVRDAIRENQGALESSAVATGMLAFLKDVFPYWSQVLDATEAERPEALEALKLVAMMASKHFLVPLERLQREPG